MSFHTGSDNVSLGLDLLSELGNSPPNRSVSLSVIAMSTKLDFASQ